MIKGFVVDDKVKSEQFLFETYGSSFNVTTPGQCEKQCVKIDNQDTNMNGLIAAAHLSFSAHVPLQLSPDILWIVILQGLAICVKQSPNDFKDFFPKEKMNIKVRNDVISLNRETTGDWLKVIDGFSLEIQKHLVNISMEDFTTTDFKSRAVAIGALMGVVDPYVSFTAMSMCGIPYVYLEGLETDWTDLLVRCGSLQKMFPSLQWWFVRLEKTLLGMMSEDQSFWQSFYKFDSGSGGDRVNGHINTFFPYITNSHGDYVKNEFFTAYFNSFPTLTSCTPIAWESLICGQQSLNMISGIPDVCQDKKTYAIRPACAWYIESNNKLKPFKKKEEKEEKFTFGYNK